jgi:hypothetical protein
VIRGSLHAIGVQRLQDGLGIRKGFRGFGKVTRGRCCLLFSCGLGSFLILHAFGVSTNLVFQGLLQHLIIMLGASLCLPQSG